MAGHVVSSAVSAPSAAQQTFDAVNPATGEVLATYPDQGEQEVRLAVTRARAAAVWWRGLSFAERRTRLLAWKAHLTRQLDPLAALIHEETGKPVDDAVLEIANTVVHLDWAARHAAAVLRPRRVSPGLAMINQAATVEYQPLGVVGVLGPWNYPVLTPMGSIAYALAAGNAVVFKPSENSTGIGRWLVDSLGEVLAGVFGDTQPVLQLITGRGATGNALVRSGVDKIAFTGSAASARKVLAAAAETLTPVLAECGGKDALIVAADAGLDAAADAAAWGAMSNAGQAGIVRRHLADALERGAHAVHGGLDSVRAPYIDPVVLTDVPEDSAAMREETFGPVVTVTPVPTLDDAVRLANASAYGLGAAVFTRSRAAGMRAARALRSGMTPVNSVISFAAIPALPFGGVGDSGFGRIHGADGLREFSRAKSITRQRMAPLLRTTTFTRRPSDLPRIKAMVSALHGRGTGRSRANR